MNNTENGLVGWGLLRTTVLAILVYISSLHSNNQLSNRQHMLFVLTIYSYSHAVQKCKLICYYCYITSNVMKFKQVYVNFHGYSGWIPHVHKIRPIKHNGYLPRTDYIIRRFYWLFLDGIPKAFHCQIISKFESRCRWETEDWEREMKQIDGGLSRPHDKGGKHDP